MVRLAILLLSRRWGLMIVGAVLIIGGLAWGITSHQVNYVSSQQSAASSYHIAKGQTSGNIYIYTDGSSDYYVALNGDFTPAIAQSDIDNSAGISFVARADTTSVDVNINGTDVTAAHQIEKLVFYDKNGSVLNTYTTAEYNANPNGFNDNEWLKSIWLVIVGLILGGAAFVYPMLSKKPQANASFNIGAAGAQPYQQPQQPYAQPQQQPNPYAQSYQGTEQYPQGTPPPPPQG